MGGGGQFSIGALHESLRHQHGVQTGAETHDASLQAPLCPTLAAQSQVELDHGDDALGEPGQVLRLREAEVVQGQIAARQDDGHLRPPDALRIVGGPFHIHEVIGHTLEKHIGAHAYATHRERAIDLETRGREDAHTLGKGLRSEFLNVGGGEGLSLAAEGGGGGNTLGDDDVGVLHHAVLGGEGGDDIFVELHGEQHDEHPQEVGQEEARQLPDADVLSE